MDLTQIFKDLTGQLANWVEVAAAVIIGIAALEATLRALLVFVRPRLPPEAKEDLRLGLARWLAVALEFELAADILRTAIAPTLQQIGLLAAIAAIRTALNYFLQKEIDRAIGREQGTTPPAVVARAQGGRALGSLLDGRPSATDAGETAEPGQQHASR
jgi:uncharacterized membrane protein